MRNQKMNNEDELSVVGWLLLIGMFAGLGYWFLQPLQPLSSVWPCVQTVLKGIAFIIMVMYQFMVMTEAGELDEVSPSVTFVSIAGTVIVQLIAIFMLFVSYDNAVDAVNSSINYILVAYAIMLLFATLAYALFSLALIATLIYSAGLGIIWVLAHPFQVMAPFAKILFRQPKQEKQDKPNKKIYF